MHLAWRWFTGLSFDQEVPHHSTFSGRIAMGAFQESNVFEQLFELAQCLAVGLVRGDKPRLMERLSWRQTLPRKAPHSERAVGRSRAGRRTVREYLAELETKNPVEEPTHSQDKVSTTDPDSTYATKGGTPARMGYYNNYLVDNDSCIVVGVQATGARLSEESRSARDMITPASLNGKAGNRNPSLPMRVMATVSSCSG